MAVRDREWPGFTRWLCCPHCERLWTIQGNDVVALDPKFALGPGLPSEEILSRACKNCEGKSNAPAAEI